MVTSMLEKAIEIEGILRIIRDGDPLPETYKLLTDKIEHLASEAASFVAESAPQASEEETAIEETQEADFIMTPPEEVPEPPKVDFTAPDPKNEKSLTIQNESIDDISATSADPIELDIDLEDEDDIILSFDDMTEPTPASEEEKHLYEATSTVNSVAPEKENLIPEDIQPENHDEKPEPKRQVKLRSAFSLNDRFMYARELFNGNMKMFDSTLGFLEGITDFSLIEEYFYSELEWNPENPNVAAFMDTLRPNFK